MEIEKVNVLGVGISALDQDRAREFLRKTIRQYVEFAFLQRRASPRCSNLLAITGLPFKCLLGQHFGTRL